jgi:hypothetical protein
MLSQVHIAWVGFELTMLVVIDADCIGSYKSNYHTITIMQIWLDNFSSDEIVKKHTEAKTVITINLVKLGITKLLLKVAFKQPQPLIKSNYHTITITTTSFQPC